MWALAPAGAAPSAPAASAPADTIVATNSPRRVTRAGLKRNCVIGIILAPRILGSRCLEPRAHDAGHASTGSRSRSVDGSYNCKELAKNCHSGEWRTPAGTARAGCAAAATGPRDRFVGTVAYSGAVAE